MKKLRSQKVNLTVFFGGLVFIVMLIACTIIGIIAIALFQRGIIQIGAGRPIVTLIILLMLLSVVLGTAISMVISKRTFAPMRSIEKATHQVAEGDFTVQLEDCGVIEIDRLVASFNKMVHELDGIETLRKDFINNFSHELKTPIVSIYGFAQLLLEDDFTPEERKDYLETIAIESKRLSELSTAILKLSKVENMEILPDKITFSLDEQLRRAILLLSPKMKEKAIHLDVDLHKADYNGSKELLQQVWTNLLDNAVKFAPYNGHIRVVLRNSEDGLVVRIADNGAGMDTATQAHIFDSFYQGETSHAKTGNGLGLPLVKKVVELHQGRITVDSEPEKGCAFTIILPQRKLS